MLGRRIGSWVIERELGRGGMGSVFEARHVSLHTQAAVKVLSPGLESGESFRQRFRREAELQAQLRHSNIARVLDYLEDSGQWFLVIEYLDRGSLADLLSRGEKVSREQAGTWMRQALAGLGHAHQKGIVHRDIKPANLMFGAAGEIVVVDFGIARADTTPGLTATGLTIGTPQYMSPEQIVTPNRVDGRADIYSLGIVLYEMLAGRRPFEYGSEFSVLQAHVSEPPPPLHTVDPTIPSELEAVVMRALAKKPEDRYPDCESMVHALDLVEKSNALGRIENAAVPAMGGTVHHLAHFEPAAVQDARGPSSGELRDRKRRAFRRRLVAGTASVLIVATVLAIQQNDRKPGSVQPPPPKSAFANTTSAGSTVTVSSTADSGPTTSSGMVTRPAVVPMPSRTEPTAPSGSIREAAYQGLIPTTTTATQPDPRSFTPPPISRPTLSPLPSAPQIAVIGMGDDPLLAAALEQEMERRLDSHRVVDERGDPDVDELLGRKDVTSKALGVQLLKGGFHILIVVRVKEGDRRTLRYDGQTATVKAARIGLNAYLLPANRTLGPGWTELVEYTELSLGGKAKQAFIGATADLRQAIDDEWAQLRAAAAR